MKKITLVAILLATGCSEPAAEPQQAANVEQENDRTNVTVTVEQLYDELAANEFAAIQKYQPHNLIVSGTIDAITLDSDDMPQLFFVGKFLNRAKAEFHNPTGLEKYSAGDKITIGCTTLTETLGTPRLNDCVVWDWPAGPQQ